MKLGGAPVDGSVVSGIVAKLERPWINWFGQLMKMLLPLQGYADDTYAQPLSGATVTCASGQDVTIIDPAGALLSLTVALPSGPVDGERACLSFTQAVTTLTLTAGTNTIKNAPASASAGSGYGFKFNKSRSTWYRLY
jgi:hypothetical protein